MTDYIENASIIYRSDIGERQCIVRVALDEGELPSFEPGQYAELALPSLDTQQEKQVQAKKLIRRAYSIASTPEISNWYEFYVVLVPSGALTPDLLLVPVGGRVWLGPKVKGKFTLTEIPEGKNVVAVSTGTGIAPFVSMVRHHINNPPWKTFTLVHGAKTEDELGYYEELSTYSYSSESFNYIPTLSRQDAIPSKGIYQGRVQRTFADDRYEKATNLSLTPEDSHIMLCGNPDMIEQMQQLFEERGFKEHKKREPGNLHFEKYWQADTNSG